MARLQHLLGLAWLCCLGLLGCNGSAPGSQQAHPTGVPAGSSPSASASPQTTAQPSATAEPSTTASAVAPPAEPAITLRIGGEKAVRGPRGMVTSSQADATRAGVEVLRRGGNAVDAAVAVGFALAVTHFSAGGLGGGGFMLVRLADGTVHAVDYREMAPAKATVQRNEQQLAAGAHGWASAPVPGVVAGLCLAQERFGSGRPLKELVAPAIKLARQGHRLAPRQAAMLSWYWPRLERDPVTRAIFARRGSKPVGAGDKLVQPSLARTLEAIAQAGPAGFYQGAVAARIDRAMQRHGGLVRLADLGSYRAQLRQPLTFGYRGFRIDTMPPPSMGGIALGSIMLGLAASRAHEAPAGSALSIHLFAEAARRAYADRRAVGADPDFVDPSVAELRRRLLDPAYYATREPAVSRTQATRSKEVEPIRPQLGAKPVAESPETTHFAVVDGQGNAVSCTTTLSAAFGAQVMVPETGIFLSNAMGGFSATGVNTLAPKKRMASSMTPTVVSQDGQLVALLGSPGGDTIPGTVAQVLQNLIDYEMTIDQAVAAGRVHHQWQPDVLRVEKDRPPAPAVLSELARLGHVVKPSRVPLGAANSILLDRASKVAFGYADDRQGGLALGP